MIYYIIIILIRSVYLFPADVIPFRHAPVRVPITSFSVPKL